jgi:23S rRNA pseudouridine955/2504/2580 synthase
MNASTEQSEVTYLEMSSANAGQRIDNFLHTYLKDIPKSHIYRILRTGEVRLNKRRVKPSYRLVAGDVLRLPPLQHQLNQKKTGA